MRNAESVGFSIGTRDRSRLEHLTEVYGAGNRSEFLRKAMSVMERMEAAEALVDLQAYGQRQAERLGVDARDIPALVEAALANPDPAAVAAAKLIVASHFSGRVPGPQSGDGERVLSPVELVVRSAPTPAAS